MKKIIKSEWIFLSLCLLFVLFNLIFFVAADLPAMQLGGWLGYAFTDVAFIIMGAVSLGFKFKADNMLAAMESLAVVCTGYFLISLLVNIIFMAVNSKGGVAPIIFNAIILIVFAILMLVTYKSISRVADNTEKREARMVGLRELSVKVNALTFLTKDDDITALVKKLKETLDYSSSAGNESSASYEEKFVKQIENIEMLLTAKADKEAILSAVETAENLWKVRNQMLMIGNKR